jgi:hypothetical protein
MHTVADAGLNTLAVTCADPIPVAAPEPTLALALTLALRPALTLPPW